VFDGGVGTLLFFSQDVNDVNNTAAAKIAFFILLYFIGY
jgi:hypothetical protein